MALTRTHTSLLGAIVLVASLALTTGAAFASGTPTGVHVDPGSPAAKEYSIPLSTARGQPSGSANSGQLFGNGITKQKAATKPKATATHSSTTTTTHTTTAATTPAATAPAAVTPPPIPPPTVTPTVTPTESVPAPTTAPAAVVHRSHHVHRRSHTRSTRKKHLAVVVAPAATPPTHHTAAAVVPAATKVLHPNSDSGWLWMVLVAVAVLAIGGLGAFVLSRSNPRAADPGLN